MQLISKLAEFLTDNNRLLWLLNISITGLLAGLLLTPNAWSTDRTYPLSPTLRGFELSPLATDLMFLIVIISLGLSLLRFSWREHFLSVSLAGLITLLAADITRLQPWVLHYLAILILFSSVINKKLLNPTKVLDAAIIVIGGMYFWSGVQKMNPRFLSEIFPWFTEPLWSNFGETGLQAVLFFGLFVPFIEAAFALGLFFKRTRRLALFSALSMHLLILLSIGPFGHNWNSSVWPWNIITPITVLILLWNNEFDIKEFINRNKKSHAAWAMLFVFWLLPIGNLVGLTDHYLSWSLYSGKVPQAALVGEVDFLHTLSEHTIEDQLRFIHWSQDDLNLVPYPERRVFIDIYRQICQRNPEQDIRLIISDPSGGLGTYQREFTCDRI